jgi:hypothetical protein
MILTIRFNPRWALTYSLYYHVENLAYGSFSGGKGGWDMKLMVHFSLLSRLRM